MRDYELKDRELKFHSANKQKTSMIYEQTQKGSSTHSEIKSTSKRSTLTKELETMEKNQTEILELNKSVNKIKIKLESLGNIAAQMEEIIDDLKNRNLDMTQVEEERKFMKELYKKYLTLLKRAIQ